MARYNELALVLVNCFQSPLLRKGSKT